MKAFKPHELEWSDEHIRRFWDYFSSNPAMEDAYFAKSVGRSLHEYVCRRIPIGAALDIGCGRGDLIEILIGKGHEVYGVDQSPASVEQVQRRFAGQSGFKGAVRIAGRFELPDACVDTAFMLEVVEHLADDALGATLSEAYRVIRPGGHLVITTPNAENLELSRTMCPECGSIYHMMQHVRSWTAKSLSDRMRGFGFETVSADATVLSPYTGLAARAFGAAYRLLRPHKLNLVYIGRRGS